MRGRIQKAAEEYNKKFFIGDNFKKNNGAFYINDLQELLEMVDQNRTITSIYKALDTALLAGFMIGYKKAKRDMRENKNGQRV